VPPSKDYLKRRAQYQKRHAVPDAMRAVSYEGFSTYDDHNTAASLHEAVQAAAKKAAREARRDGVALPEWYEVTRVRILVGNPNVKVYGATIAPGPPTSP
jgi:hypothetical protein